MKTIAEKIFPAIAFVIAITCALKTTKAETGVTIVTASVYEISLTPTCVVVGTCEPVGTSICTDVYGNVLHRYHTQSETCLSYALGVFISNED